MWLLPKVLLRTTKNNESQIFPTNVFTLYPIYLCSFIQRSWQHHELQRAALFVLSQSHPFSLLLRSSSPLWSSAALPTRATSIAPTKWRSTASSIATKTPVIMVFLWAPWTSCAAWPSLLWTSTSLRSAASKIARKLCWLILECQVNTCKSVSFYRIMLLSLFR